MSLTDQSGTAPAARLVRNILKGAAAALSGKQRGPDHGAGRVPRRNSYDVDDSRAKPWSRIGDGSVAQGLAYRDALVQVAEELHHKGWKEMPAREVRAARDRRKALAAELEAHTAAGVAPVGRPATIRQELARIDALLDRARARLRAVDVKALKALLRTLDFATGALFPTIETIAEAAALHRNTAVASLRRLKAHGLIEWVRRSIRTGNEGAFAPQREQTSNAYYFAHRAHMAPRVWQRYWQILVAKLRRAPTAQPQLRPEPPVGPPSRDVAALRAAVGRLGTAIGNASS